MAALLALALILPAAALGEDALWGVDVPLEWEDGYEVEAAPAEESVSEVEGYELGLEEAAPSDGTESTTEPSAEPTIEPPTSARISISSSLSVLSCRYCASSSKVRPPSSG